MWHNHWMIQIHMNLLWHNPFPSFTVSTDVILLTKYGTYCHYLAKRWSLRVQFWSKFNVTWVSISFHKAITKPIHNNLLINLKKKTLLLLIKNSVNNILCCLICASDCTCKRNVAKFLKISNRYWAGCYMSVYELYCHIKPKMFQNTDW